MTKVIFARNEMDTPIKLMMSRIIEQLEKGTIDLQGQIAWGSNYTFLGQLEIGEESLQVIYKPEQGERPLWDFPAGTLCLRERAAYLISNALGWHIVPPTVLRDGPFGFGSVQQFIEHDPQYHFLNLPEADINQLQQIALFDLMINNADRKSGHVLIDVTKKLWAIDHGICFHEQDKLRTVIWDFAEQLIPDSLLANIDSLHKQFATTTKTDWLIELEQYLTQSEINALQLRITNLLHLKQFPKPGSGRHTPWPLI